MQKKKPQNKDSNIKLSRYIDKRRKEMGISIAELSEVIGISRDTYRRKLSSGEGFSERSLQLAGLAVGVTFNGQVVIDDSLSVFKEKYAEHLLGENAAQITNQFKGKGV